MGKSTLFNRLIGDERSVVHDLPGTTRDSIDTLVSTPEGDVRFIDTAGMRRRAKEAEGAEYYSLVRALQALDRADAALCWSSTPPRGSPARTSAWPSGSTPPAARSWSILNKWELSTPRRGPRVGRGRGPAGVPRLRPGPQGQRPDRAAGCTGCTRRCGRRWPPRAGGSRPRSSTGSSPRPRPPTAPRAAGSCTPPRAATDPPTFTLFATRPVPAPYLRYLERRIREHFGFGPTPVGVPGPPPLRATMRDLARTWWSSSVVSMFTQPWLAAAAVFCAVAAALWGRAAARLARAARRIEAETASSSHGRDATELARAAFDKDLHTALLYAILTVGFAVASISTSGWYQIPLLAVGIPVVVSIRYAPRFFDEARLAENRAMLERRAEEVLAQEELAPRRWADRLAPEEPAAHRGLRAGPGVRAGHRDDGRRLLRRVPHRPPTGWPV